MGSSSSTYPVIFGIRTVECIVAVIQEGAGQIWCFFCFVFSTGFNSSLNKNRVTAAYPQGDGLGGRKERRGVMLLLIPGLCRVKLESEMATGGKRKVIEERFLVPRKERRVSAGVLFARMSRLVAGLSFFFLAACL